MTLRAIEFISILSFHQNIVSSLIDEGLLGLIFPFFEYNILSFKSKTDEYSLYENIIDVIFNLLVLLKDERLTRVLNRVSKPGFINSIFDYRNKIESRISARIKNIENIESEDMLTLKVEEGLLVKYKISFILTYYILSEDNNPSNILPDKTENPLKTFDDMKNEAIELNSLIDNQNFKDVLIAINLINN